MSTARLRLTLPGGAALAFQAFSLTQTRPTVSRRLGLLADAREASVALDNLPAWALRFALGPLTRADSRELRRSVGARVEAIVDDPDRPPADWPHSEVWINEPLPNATVSAVRVRRLADDPAAGSSYDLELTYGSALPMGGLHPRAPEPVYPDGPIFQEPFPPRVLWPGSVTFPLAELGMNIRSLAIRGPDAVGTIAVLGLGEMEPEPPPPDLLVSPDRIAQVGVDLTSFAVRGPDAGGTIAEVGVRLE